MRFEQTEIAYAVKQAENDLDSPNGQDSIDLDAHMSRSSKVVHYSQPALGVPFQYEL